MEKILTREIVKKLGLDKLEVITSDMLDGYTSIADNAFQHCHTLTFINLSNSITSIGKYAFYDCSSLISINFPNSITNIKDSAFICCSHLVSITISNPVTSIGNKAFYNCCSLISIFFPYSITSIKWGAFSMCNKLKSIVIENKIYETQEIINNKCKAYKAFNANLTCRGFQYEEGKTYEIDRKPELCKQGFHACLNLKDVFNYYYGEFGKDIVVHEVELEGVSKKTSIDDSKVVAKKITIGKRIL